MSKTLESRLLRQLGRASQDFQLFEGVTHVAVGLSGGKDSWALTYLLKRYTQFLAHLKPAVNIQLTAITVDTAQEDFPREAIGRICEQWGVAWRRVEAPLTLQLKEQRLERSPCSLCARIRRAILHQTAREIGANALALGHHREDAVETLLLNLFYAGKLESFTPRLEPEQGVALIRPLVLCEESDLAELAKNLEVPLAKCDCGFARLEGRPPDFHRRQMRQLLDQLEMVHGQGRGYAFAALEHQWRALNPKNS